MVTDVLRMFRSENAIIGRCSTSSEVAVSRDYLSRRKDLTSSLIRSKSHHVIIWCPSTRMNMWTTSLRLSSYPIPSVLVRRSKSEFFEVRYRLWLCESKPGLLICTMSSSVELAIFSMVISCIYAVKRFEHCVNRKRGWSLPVRQQHSCGTSARYVIRACATCLHLHDCRRLFVCR